MKSIVLVLLFCFAFGAVQANDQNIYFVFTKQCYKSLVQDLDFGNTECVSLTVSKIMGYGLVVGGAIVKIPQVIKILLERSMFGISFTSVFLEGLTNWVTIVYSWYRGNPFSIYGQNVFILIQNLLILFLFVLFWRNVPKGQPIPERKIVKRYIGILILFVVSMFLTSDPSKWPPEVINSCIILQIVLFATARLTQIQHIYKCKSTGSLSFITAALILLGNLGRLFTVYVEISDDYMFALSVVLAAFLNGTIFVQFLIYWKSNPKTEKATKVNVKPKRQ